MKKVTILGYVNAVERASRKMSHPVNGVFVEVIQPKAFEQALMYLKDLPILVDHENTRKIASLNNGVKYLYEDSVGLRIEVDIGDEKIIQAAKNNKITGWSFAFNVIEDEWKMNKNGYYERSIKKMQLNEISLLTKSTPAYPQTTWEIKGKPRKPLTEREIELQIMEKELDLLKLKTKGMHVA